MDKLIKNMFKPTPKSVAIRPSSDNDKVINEAIILDTLGSTEKLETFYENIGSFGARDGLLNECSTLDCPTVDHAEIAAVLACAKEAGSSDFEMYTRAKEAEKAYFARMSATFGITAKERVAKQKEALDANGRVQDAIEKTEACCKS